MSKDYYTAKTQDNSPLQKLPALLLLLESLTGASQEQAHSCGCHRLQLLVLLLLGNISGSPEEL